MRLKSIRERSSKWLQLALIIFLSLISSVTLTRLTRYFSRLLRQPVLIPNGAPNADLQERIEAQAYQIAIDNLLQGLEVRSLEDGTEKTILCAGIRNFREPWARDTGFAHHGLLELGMYDATREALEVFLLTQNSTGQFAVKVHSTSVMDRFLHSLFKRVQPIDRPIRPKYITAHNTISLDGNCLIVSAVLNYARRAEDYEFAQAHWGALKQAVRWLEKHEEAGEPLLTQGTFTDWADSVARQGKVLYTNVIYWKTLNDMAEAARRYGSEADEKFFCEKADDLQAAIDDHFWRSDLGYYVTSRMFDNLSSSGNLLAIAWGLAKPEQAHLILNAMRDFGMADPVPTKVVHRAYPKKFIAIENRLAGIGDYHTYFAWLWLGSWHVIALAKMERFEEANELLTRMSRVIVRDGAVHEVYAPTGEYASNLWYTSESPLTWNAGMFVYAWNYLKGYLGQRETS